MHATLKSYLIGFILSLTLTLAAFFVVFKPSLFHLSTDAILGTILALAVIQLMVQLIFFLHLGNESGPRWRLGAFLATLGIVLIVLVGSLWIMAHLNYNMMASPTQMNAYIQSQDGF